MIARIAERACVAYPEDVESKPPRFWERLQDGVSDLLVVVGLALIGGGIYYRWQGWAFATYVLLVAAAVGSFSLGSGTLIHRRPSATRLTASAIAFGLSAVLMLGLFAISPPLPGIIPVVLAPCLGLVASVARLRALSG